MIEAWPITGRELRSVSHEYCNTTLSIFSGVLLQSCLMTNMRYLLHPLPLYLLVYSTDAVPSRFVLSCNPDNFVFADDLIENYFCRLAVYRLGGLQIVSLRSDARCHHLLFESNQMTCSSEEMH